MLLPSGDQINTNKNIEVKNRHNLPSWYFSQHKQQKHKYQKFVCRACSVFFTCFPASDANRHSNNFFDKLIFTKLLPFSSVFGLY